MSRKSFGDSYFRRLDINQSKLTLLILFSGIFEKNEGYLKMSICPRHQDAYEMLCSVPSEWSAHKKNKAHNGDRGITFPQSVHIYSLTSVLVPVASRK